jgi:hypothetical protein
MNAGAQKTLAHSWLLLIHQLPAKPAYLRVKIWRRLQSMGAIAVKNAVHALPMNEETQEDFEWLLREIVEGGGEAFLCEARLIDGLSDEEVRTLFDKARDADYGEIVKETRSLTKSLRPNAKAATIAEHRAQAARLRKRLAEVVAIDFFGAIGRETAEGLLSSLETRLNEDEPVTSKAIADSQAANLGELRSRTWVTRQGVYVDRIASAWLIRRFIDPEARFKFVSGKGYRPEPGSCASTCSRRNSPTRATSARSRCCSIVPDRRTAHCGRSARSCMTSISRTVSSVVPRWPASRR